MDLRTGITGTTGEERSSERRMRVEKELQFNLHHLQPSPDSVGHADEKNCEQMLGHVPLPVGYAGPLKLMFSSGETNDIHLPLATTEGALVAGVNRGCKALSSLSVRLSSSHHGISRSLAFRVSDDVRSFTQNLEKSRVEWTTVAEGTSSHLKILKSEIDVSGNHVFLTLWGNTDEAMGMNMITIAAQAVGQWVQSTFPTVTFVTVAGNVDSDKKSSKRTHDRGRGYEVTAEAVLTNDVITSVLKSVPEDMLATAHAKLTIGSEIAGALGHNLHAANIIAALYLATGQDAAHVVEGSLTDTTVEKTDDGLRVKVRLPAIIVGVRGGGTTLPAQSQCLKMLLHPKTSLHPCAQLAESIGAAVLAGEVSLLAAQASHTLTSAHQKLGRNA